jgi:hypothetical protein
MIYVRFRAELVECYIYRGEKCLGENATEMKLNAHSMFGALLLILWVSR